MRPDDTLKKLSNLTVWKKGGQRAPHKPLLILLYLGRLQRNESRLGYYEDIRDKLVNLLIEFGPPRKRHSAKHPFVRLCNDDIWDLKGEISLDPKREWGERELVRYRAQGGFKEEIYNVLKEDPSLIKETAKRLLNQEFPETQHEDILDAVGLNIGGIDISGETERKSRRDPKFREYVMRAYEYRCAVCGFNVRLGNSPVALEAAHIRWFTHGGPDIVNNGIALCTLHHKLFDRGVFTLNEDFVFQVAENAHGTIGFEEWLMRYHGNKLRNPQSPEYEPNQNYIYWHVKEVFKGPARYNW